jgi:hypothetical protein
MRRDIQFKEGWLDAAEAKPPPQRPPADPLQEQPEWGRAKQRAGVHVWRSSDEAGRRQGRRRNG